MKPKYRAQRRSRQIKNIKRQRGKYPLLAEEIVQMSDIVLEILDSRFIIETRNFEIEKQIKDAGKKIIYVFNKSDLIDYKRLIKKGTLLVSPRVFVSCTSRKGGKELREKIKVLANKIERPADNVSNRIIVGVVGYPNTGKSSVINLLVGKKVLGTGADAGFTKGIHKVKLTKEILLLDSPGIIPNKEYSSSESQTISKHTKLGARSYSQVKEPEIVVSDLMKEFPGVFEDFYKIKAKGDSEILIEKLGRQKGFLKKGNQVDDDATARLIIKNWQDGRIRV
ncbi:ribosome biogenesis GTPase A [archaeon BMS3Abin17]|nr:ribosome biogenesis GTPase A [archaeon BMS3Abin17]HDZ61512.1 hypothetical protein [Candidatus Pacearchaeota archaeon]